VESHCVSASRPVFSPVSELGTWWLPNRLSFA
jgi:hypothetical protein